VIDPSNAPEDPPAPRRSPALILAVTLAVLLALAVAVLAVLLAGSDEDERQVELRRAAGRFGEALVTYDFDDPEAHRDTVLELSTGSFSEEYEDAFDAGLGQLITEVEAVSKGTVKDVYLSELGEADAQAIVVLDVEITGVAGPRTMRDVYIRLTFVEVAGEWKVDQVIDLNFATGGTTPTTTSTTPSAPESTTTSI
jgi:hypothetical protein